MLKPSLAVPHSTADFYLDKVVIVRREDIPTLTKVTIDGEDHSLGILKDLRKHTNLARFIPEYGRVSLAWVRLEKGEVLANHEHPTASMVVICQGEGRVTGDLDAMLHAGDIVAIPPGCQHGFIGAGDSGHWALSIQFEGKGLYEDPSQGRVRFIKNKSDNLHCLLEQSESRANKHKDNPLFSLVTSPQINELKYRAALLDCIQVWSNCFHRILLVRSAVTESGPFLDLFEQHLSEEFSHNADLAKDRGAALKRVWDPVLDSTCHWFIWKMLTLDARAKLVLVHMVLEVGAAVFHEIANPILTPFQETQYFKQHDEADPSHRVMGLNLLEDIDSVNYRHLLQVLNEGWDMLEALCARIAEIARNA